MDREQCIEIPCFDPWTSVEVQTPSPYPWHGTASNPTYGGYRRQADTREVRAQRALSHVPPSMTPNKDNGATPRDQPPSRAPPSSRGRTSRPFLAAATTAVLGNKSACRLGDCCRCQRPPARTADRSFRQGAGNRYSCNSSRAKA